MGFWGFGATFVALVVSKSRDTEHFNKSYSDLSSRSSFFTLLPNGAALTLVKIPDRHRVIPFVPSY